MASEIRMHQDGLEPKGEGLSSLLQELLLELFDMLARQLGHDGVSVPVLGQLADEGFAQSDKV